MALVERVGGFLGADVGVPEREGLIAAVERAGLVAEAEVVLVAGHLLGDGEAAELEAYGATHGVGGDDVAGEIANDEAEGIALDADFERGGAEADGGIVLHRLHVDGFRARGGENCPGSVFGKSAGSDAHAEDVVAKGCDAQSRCAGLDFNAVAQGLGTGYGIECCRGLRGGGLRRRGR